MARRRPSEEPDSAVTETTRVPVAKMRARTPTMEDVAARAGVSRALVSIVFRDRPGASPATRRRVRDVASQLGYVPDHRARLLSRSRTGVVGVVFGLQHEFHGEIVEALYAAAGPLQYELVVSGAAPSRAESVAIASLLSYRCEAVILVGSSLGPRALADLAARVPLVVMARKAGHAAADVVRTDDVAGGRLATRHLLDRGHRRIVYLDAKRASGSSERRLGYRRAMRSSGEPVRLLPGGTTEEDGIAAARQLLAEREAGQEPAPTAVFAFNDRCALGLMTTLRAAGLHVPRDVSVVGYDDSRVARMPWVDLTTIRQDTSLLATQAVAMAAERIENLGPARDVVVPPELIVRGTSAERPG